MFAVTTLDRTEFDSAAPLLAFRFETAFGVPAPRATATALELLASLPTDAVAVVGRGVLVIAVPWRSPTGETYFYVGAIGYEESSVSSLPGALDLLRQELARGRTSAALIVPTAPVELPLISAMADAAEESLLLRAPCGGDVAESPEIRRAVPDDRPFIASLLTEAIRRGFLLTQASVPADPILERETARLLDDIYGPNGIALVGIKEGRLVAHASGVVRPWDEFAEGPLAELFDVFTLPAFSGRGIGDSLQACFRYEAALRGARTAEGHIVPDRERVDNANRVLAHLKEYGWRAHRYQVRIGTLG